MPARNALLADVVHPSAYGRAYGFERAMDNLGAVFGPLLALGLVAVVGVRWAIGLSVIPGLLAALAIVYAIRAAPKAEPRERQPIRASPAAGSSGSISAGCWAAIAAFEVGNVAATLLILRATDLLTPAHGSTAATSLALGSTSRTTSPRPLASIPAGRLSDRLGDRGPILVLIVGVVMFALAYPGFGIASASVIVLAVPFILAGIGIGASKPPNTPPSPPSPRATPADPPSVSSPPSRPRATSPPAPSRASCGPPSPRPPPSATSSSGWCWPSSVSSPPPADDNDTRQSET